MLTPAQLTKIAIATTIAARALIIIRNVLYLTEDLDDYDEPYFKHERSYGGRTRSRRVRYEDIKAVHVAPSNQTQTSRRHFPKLPFKRRYKQGGT